MFTRRTVTTMQNINSDNVIVAIVTNNLTQVRSLINRTNVNNVIDDKNGYTAIHYAVTLPNNDITEYILECGANPLITEFEGYDAYELSLRSGKKFIFDYYKKKQQKRISDLETENDSLKIKIDDLRRREDYYARTIDDYNKKLEKINRFESENKILANALGKKTAECNELKTENARLKRNLEESETAFSNLLKKQKK
jgi:ankyrin repeat protein